MLCNNWDDDLQLPSIFQGGWDHQPISFLGVQPGLDVKRLESWEQWAASNRLFVWWTSLTVTPGIWMTHISAIHSTWCGIVGIVSIHNSPFLTFPKHWYPSLHASSSATMCYHQSLSSSLWCFLSFGHIPSAISNAGLPTCWSQHLRFQSRYPSFTWSLPGSCYNPRRQVRAQDGDKIRCEKFMWHWEI